MKQQGPEHPSSPRALTRRTAATVPGAWGWSERRERERRLQKEMMGRYFAQHDFLVQPGRAPDSELPKTEASVMVNPGTKSNTVVRFALEAMGDRWGGDGPFQVTWHTPSILVPATLRAFNVVHPGFHNAAKLFLFPGEVDHDVASVLGGVPTAFVRDLKVKFTYSLLSVFSFDLETGCASFHFAKEVDLQQECALKKAEHKFLFLDSTMLTGEGNEGYTLCEVLASSKTVTVYVDSSKQDKYITKRFQELQSRLLVPADPKDEGYPKAKSLSLRIIKGNEDTASDNCPFCGYLVDRPRRNP